MSPKLSALAFDELQSQTAFELFGYESDLRVIVSSRDNKLLRDSFSLNIDSLPKEAIEISGRFTVSF